jgi:hypothetical protein
MSRVLKPFGGRLRGSMPGLPMMEFVAASVRQRKPVVALSDAGEFGRQVGQVPRDEMDDLPFPLNPALHRKHAGREDDAALAFVERRPDHKVGEDQRPFVGFWVGANPERSNDRICFAMTAGASSLSFLNQNSAQDSAPIMVSRR